MNTSTEIIWDLSPNVEYDNSKVCEFCFEPGNFYNILYRYDVTPYTCLPFHESCLFKFWDIVDEYYKEVNSESI